MTKSGSTDWISVIPFLYTLSGKGLKIYPRDVLKKKCLPRGRGIGLRSLQKRDNAQKYQTIKLRLNKFSVYNLFIATPYRKGCIKIWACLPLKRCSAMRTVKLGHKNWSRMSWPNPFIALFCYSCLWLVTRNDVSWLHRNWAILLSARNSSLADLRQKIELGWLINRKIKLFPFYLPCFG